MDRYWVAIWLALVNGPLIPGCVTSGILTVISTAMKTVASALWYSLLPTVGLAVPFAIYVIGEAKYRDRTSRQRK